MNLARLANATVEEVLANPAYYGMPTTPAEIRAFMARIRNVAEAKFASADRGSTLLSAYVKSHRYFVEGPEGVVDCGKSLERAEKAAQDMGLNLRELEMFPEVKPDAGRKCDIHVTFRKKKSPILLPGMF